jgi:hypothetical protein
LERRRVQLDNAALRIDSGWNYGFLLMATAVGLVLGLFVGFKDQFLGTSVDRDERYLVLSSSLYGLDPSVLPTIRQRLGDLGFTNASYTIIRMSERFAASRDRQRQREADGLRLFGEALGSQTDTQSGQPRLTASQSPVPAGVVVLSTATPAATATETPSVLVLPTSVAGGNPATPAAGPARPAAPAAAAPPAPAPPTPTAQPGVTMGTVKSADKVPVRIRTEPSTQSPTVMVVPVGTKVQVIRVDKGSASDPGIDPAEIRWFYVKNGNVTGYVYYKLLALGE